LNKSFRFDEAWDSPSNRKLHGLRPPNFFCPDDPEGAEKGFTNNVAVVGPKTVFPSSGKARKPAEIRDDPTRTLMLVECKKSGIHSMEPRDLEWDKMSFDLNDPARPSISSEHHVGSYPGPHVVTVTRATGYLPAGMAPDTLRALLTMHDGETVQFTAGPKK
jgi:hypothetical protein